jgi:hypothetical protein
VKSVSSGFKKDRAGLLTIEDDNTEADRGSLSPRSVEVGTTIAANKSSASETSLQRWLQVIFGALSYHCCCHNIIISSGITEHENSRVESCGNQDESNRGEKKASHGNRDIAGWNRETHFMFRSTMLE